MHDDELKKTLDGYQHAAAVLRLRVDALKLAEEEMKKALEERDAFLRQMEAHFADQVNPNVVLYNGYAYRYVKGSFGGQAHVWIDKVINLQ